MQPSAHAILKNTALLSLVALLSSRLCLAQVEPWERIRLIDEGKNVSVTLFSGEKVNGKMGAWTVDGIQVRKGDKAVTVEKGRVERVELVTGMSRGRKAAWAGGITGGIVAGLGGPVCAKHRCGIAAIAGSAALYGGLAAGIAALFPPHKELSYRAPPPIGSVTGIRLMSQENAAVTSGAKIRFKLQLTGTDGKNLSSPVLGVRAVGVSSTQDPAASVTPLSREANPVDAFFFDERIGDSGGYVFELNTTGLEPGSYVLHFQAGKDPQDRTVGFRVK